MMTSRVDRSFSSLYRAVGVTSGLNAKTKSTQFYLKGVNLFIDLKNDCCHFLCILYTIY